MTVSLRGRLATFAIATMFAAIAQPGFTQAPKYKPISVKTPDGLTIAAQEWGNPAGPEILLIHGFAQSHLSWMRQVSGDLAKEFRIVTYDLRGHGASDKPDDKARYHDNKAWADEVKAVIDAAGLKRPVLVGWSYAGRVDLRLCDDPRTGQARRHQLRRRQHQVLSGIRRRQPEERSRHDVGRSRHQHCGDALVRARLLREAADRGGFRGHALVQHDGAAAVAHAISAAARSTPPR